MYQVNRLFDDLLGTTKIRLSVLPFDTDLNINELTITTDEARFKCHNPHISLGVKLSCLASKVFSEEGSSEMVGDSFQKVMMQVEQDHNALYRWESGYCC